MCCGKERQIQLFHFGNSGKNQVCDITIFDFDSIFEIVFV